MGLKRRAFFSVFGGIGGTGGNITITGGKVK